MDSALFNRVAEIVCQLDVYDGAQIEFLDALEVSFDCMVCKRKRRTVIFQLGEEYGRCTPTNKCVGFSGRLVAKMPAVSGDLFSVRYVIEYAYAPFLDVKYDDESIDYPTWARVNFLVRCPKCHEKIKLSTQSNMVRPWTQVCTCGELLYTEIDDMPLLEWREKTYPIVSCPKITLRTRTPQ